MFIYQMAIKTVNKTCVDCKDELTEGEFDYYERMVSLYPKRNLDARCYQCNKGLFEKVQSRWGRR